MVEKNKNRAEDWLCIVLETPSKLITIKISAKMSAMFMNKQTPKTHYLLNVCDNIVKSVSLIFLQRLKLFNGMQIIDVTRRKCCCKLH